MNQEELNKLLNDNKDLFWDVKDINKLDEIAIEERFLKYGNWKNILTLIKIYGKKTFKNIFLEIQNKPRCDLSKKTINFFNIYLDV